MKSFAIIAALGAVIVPVFAKGNLPPVSVKGNAFFANNQRFYMRGVAYQPGTFLYKISRCWACADSDSRWCR